MTTVGVKRLNDLVAGRSQSAVMSGGITVGLRVVRGDDWQWKDQDGGEGSVGTVVEVGGQGSSKNPDNTVVVVWDTGVRANYRAGYEGKDDLRCLDNAPSGQIPPPINSTLLRLDVIHFDKQLITVL